MSSKFFSSRNDNKKDVKDCYNKAKSIEQQIVDLSKSVRKIK